MKLMLVAIVATLGAGMAIAKPVATLEGTPKGASEYQRDLAPELDSVVVSLSGALRQKETLCGPVGPENSGSVAEYLELCS